MEVKDMIPVKGEGDTLICKLITVPGRQHLLLLLIIGINFSNNLSISKIINYKIRKLAEIDRHEEFVVADFYM